VNTRKTPAGIRNDSIGGFEGPVLADCDISRRAGLPFLVATRRAVYRVLSGVLESDRRMGNTLPVVVSMTS
jgi:hypothetical protein